MIRLLTAVLLVMSFHAFADDLIEFQNGDVIRAEDFNHNFQKLEQDIANGVAGPTSSSGVAWHRGWSRLVLEAVQPAYEAFEVLERLGGKCWRRDGTYSYQPDDDCQLWVMGVTDHRQCQVDMSASTNPYVDQLVVTPAQSHIHFDRMHLLSGFGAVHIAINCSAQ